MVGSAAPPSRLGEAMDMHACWTNMETAPVIGTIWFTVEIPTRHGDVCLLDSNGDSTNGGWCCPAKKVRISHGWLFGQQLRH